LVGARFQAKGEVGGSGLRQPVRLAGVGKFGARALQRGVVETAGRRD
jgi:hypothetical protein